MLIECCKICRSINLFDEEADATDKNLVKTTCLDCGNTWHYRKAFIEAAKEKTTQHKHKKR